MTLRFKNVAFVALCPRAAKFGLGVGHPYPQGSMRRGRWVESFLARFLPPPSRREGDEEDARLPLLTASNVGSDRFEVCDWELHQNSLRVDVFDVLLSLQVSIVGVIRGLAPFVTNVQYSVDDMTGPPLNVKQWLNAEACGALKLVKQSALVALKCLTSNADDDLNVVLAARRPPGLHHVLVHVPSKASASTSLQLLNRLFS
ncbi:hypothetical protein PAMA_011242 [Pampus argenteus]